MFAEVKAATDSKPRISWRIVSSLGYDQGSVLVPSPGWLAVTWSISSDSGSR